MSAHSESSSRHNDLAGTTPHAKDRELAQLLEATYALAAQRRDPAAAGSALPSNWQLLDNTALAAAGISPADLHDAKSGFDAAIYRHSDGTVAVAYNGTDQLRDWRSNLRQGIGLTDTQYDMSVALASKAQQAWGPNVVLTGHSLGGGLAATAGMVHQIPTVTFNAAGVHDATLERYERNPDVLKREAAQGGVRSYEVRNELLTWLQEDNLVTRWVMPDAPGARIELPDPDPRGLLQRIVPGAMLPHRLDLHGIGAVLQAYDKADLSERGHGELLLMDAARGLAPLRGPLGLNEDARFYNAATHVAAHACQDGLQRIDHLFATVDQQRLVAVQGAADDPAHRRSVVLAEAAARTPALESYDRLTQDSMDAERHRQQANAQAQTSSRSLG